MDITNYDSCMGCSLCVVSCPVNAINQSFNRNKCFWYPEIDENKCIKCNKCINSCPQNNKNAIPNKGFRLLAQSTDIELLKNATSGGVASALARAIVKTGGVVYGAAFVESMHLEHIRCISEKECEKIKGSKYVQSDIVNVYSQIERDLKDNRQVLFIGTPCQCVSVKKKFENYNNFYCCDFICNGVGSPILFRKHIDYLEKKHKCKIISYNFRPKKYNYLEPYELFCDDAGNEYHIKSPWKKWGSIYYAGLTLRPSCNECKYIKSEARVGNITFSDIPMHLWDAAEFPYEIKRYGGSLISVNDARGRELVNMCSSLYVKNVEHEMNDKNKHLSHDPNKRDAFLGKATESLDKAKKQYLGYQYKLKGVIIELLERMKRKDK